LLQLSGFYVSVLQGSELEITNVRFSSDGDSLLYEGDNRIAANQNSSVVLNVTAEVAQNSSAFRALWVKDGRVLIDVTLTEEENGSVSTNYSITSVDLNNTGVYQVLLISNDTIWYSSDPVRVDTG